MQGCVLNIFIIKMQSSRFREFEIFLSLPRVAIRFHLLPDFLAHALISLRLVKGKSDYGKTSFARPDEEKS